VISGAVEACDTAAMAPVAERTPDPPPAEEMSWIPGGTFLMGSADFAKPS